MKEKLFSTLGAHLPEMSDDEIFMADHKSKAGFYQKMTLKPCMVLRAQQFFYGVMVRPKIQVEINIKK